MACTSTVPSKIDSKKSLDRSSSSTTSIRHEDSNSDTCNVNADWFISNLFLERVWV